MVPVVDLSNDEAMRSALRRIAPGTDLRDGLDRILRGRTGGLVVLGGDAEILDLCSGGFELDVEFAATRLRELAKMDGAVVLSRDGSRILRAATQLLPDRSVPTAESETRHRTAERVARQTGVPVIAVSESMSTITLYLGEHRHILEDRVTVLAHANQALQTLERYRARLDEVTTTLSALEIEDLVTAKDLMVVAQRLEMVRRISQELEQFVLELGTEGRLVALQLEELAGGVDRERALILRDYSRAAEEDTVARAGEDLARLNAIDLLDLSSVSRAFGIQVDAETIDQLPVSPSGYRLLHRIPRLPSTVVDRIVEHFDGFQALLAASLEDLMQVDGVGEARARAIREGLSRIAESSIMERYV